MRILPLIAYVLLAFCSALYQQAAARVDTHPEDRHTNVVATHTPVLRSQRLEVSGSLDTPHDLALIQSRLDGSHSSSHAFTSRSLRGLVRPRSRSSPGIFSDKTRITLGTTDHSLKSRDPRTATMRSMVARRSTVQKLQGNITPHPCVRLPSHWICESRVASSYHKRTSDTGLGKAGPNTRIKGTIVIVIDDFGYRNDALLDAFMHLEARLTYAIIPGHAYSSSTAAMAHKRGYEVLVHMPMEALGPAPGELDYRLNRSMPSEEIRRRLRAAFWSLPQAAGLNNHQGSAATGDVRVMRVVGSELMRAGKFFLDSRTSPWSVAEVSMKPYGVATAHRDVFLDHYDNIQFIREQLNVLADIARIEGFAVGIGHVRYNTLQVLRDAIPRLKETGFEFAYASQVVR